MIRNFCRDLHTILPEKPGETLEKEPRIFGWWDVLVHIPEPLPHKGRGLNNKLFLENKRRPNAGGCSVLGPERTQTAWF